MFAKFIPNKNVLLVHLNIVLYAFAYWLTNPILPFLLKSFGGGSLSFGTFQSLFNLVQLGGGLVVGYLSDHYSGSTALSLTQIGSACVYLALLSATSMEGLYFSRVLTVIQQAMQVGQAIISKSVPTEDRAVHFGRLSLSYALGMTSGSYLSGKVGPFFGDESAAIYLAIIASLITLPLNVFFLENPASVPATKEISKKDSQTATSSSQKNTSPRTSSTSSPLLLPQPQTENYLTLSIKLKRILIFLSCIYSSRAIFEPVYSAMMLNHYNIQQNQMGEFVSVFAGIGFVSNVVVLPFLLKLFNKNETAVIRLAILLGVGAFAGLALLRPETVSVFLALFGGVTFAGSILYTLSTSYISSTTSPEYHGQTIAMTHALRSGVGIICPIIGSFLFEHFGGVADSGSALFVVCGLNAALLGLSMLLL